MYINEVFQVASVFNLYVVGPAHKRECMKKRNMIETLTVNSQTNSPIQAEWEFVNLKTKEMLKRSLLLTSYNTDNIQPGTGFMWTTHKSITWM